MSNCLKRTIFLCIAECCLKISNKHINKSNRQHYKAQKYLEKGRKYLAKGKQVAENE